MQTSVTPVAPPAPPLPPGITPEQQAQFRQMAREADAMQRELLRTQQEMQGVQGIPAGIPNTPGELRALKARRSTISDQLISASNRREELARELEKSRSPVTAEGIEQRIRVLDARILQLESDLAETGRLLQLAPASALGQSTETAPARRDGIPINEGGVIAIGSLVTLFVLAPLAFTAARIWWRRATGAIPKAPAKADSERLERLETAVETIALEMERVSEGQRFMTRLLTEGRAEAPAFNAASRGEPLRVPASGERS